MTHCLRLSAAVAFAMAMLMVAAQNVSARQLAKSAAVVELFTSQGCSSCPPADALLERYAKRDDVVALTFNVDYWDYLGWKDTLASPANTARQQAYRQAHGARSVYTPQTVINGIIPAPGYDAGAIDAALARSARQIGPYVPMTVQVTGAMLEVRILDMPRKNVPRQGTVWLVLFSEKEEVDITRGENAGRKITYFNVVREMMPIGTWSGSATSIDLSKSDVLSRGHEGCAVLLQAGTAGPILGAARLESW